MGWTDGRAERDWHGGGHTDKARTQGRTEQQPRAARRAGAGGRGSPGGLSGLAVGRPRPGAPGHGPALSRATCSAVRPLARPCPLGLSSARQDRTPGCPLRPRHVPKATGRGPRPGSANPGGPGGVLPCPLLKLLVRDAVLGHEPVEHQDADGHVHLPGTGQAVGCLQPLPPPRSRTDSGRAAEPPVGPRAEPTAAPPSPRCPLLLSGAVPCATLAPPTPHRAGHGGSSLT